MPGYSIILACVAVWLVAMVTTVHGKCKKRPGLTSSKVVHGGWASWTQVSPCTVTCGEGHYQRSRTCTKPAPRKGGRPCEGDSTSTAGCSSLASCPAQKCDRDHKHDPSTGACVRQCDQYGEGFTLYDGEAVEGQNDLFFATSGDINKCIALCLAESITTLSIDFSDSEDGCYCSTKAPGMKGVAISNPPGYVLAVRQCGAPLDGGWGPWGSYGACSKTCGGGSQTRHRACHHPSSHWKKACVGGGFTSTQTCQAGACPVDGQLTTWTMWGSCSISCGGGSRTRVRSCIPPTDGGAPCSGELDQTSKCRTRRCPVNGSWGSWYQMSECTRTCGGGTYLRLRDCNDPQPRFGGDECVGEETSHPVCNDYRCPGE